MSAGGAELVHRAIAAFERGDATGFADCFEPDAEFRLPRNLVEGGSYWGHAGVRRAVADAYETWSSIEFELEDVELTEQGLVVRATVTNTPRGGGPAITYRATYGVRVGEGGITYWCPYDGRAEALVGLGAVR